MTELFRRLHYLFNRRRFDRELASEMEFHREMASRQTGAPLGNTLRLREESRDAWGWTWLDQLTQDVNYAARQLRKSPLALTDIWMGSPIGRSTSNSK